MYFCLAGESLSIFMIQSIIFYHHYQTCDFQPSKVLGLSTVRTTILSMAQCHITTAMNSFGDPTAQDNHPGRQGVLLNPLRSAPGFAASSVA